jgi:hypothetical protein
MLDRLRELAAGQSGVSVRQIIVEIEIDEAEGDSAEIVKAVALKVAAAVPKVPRPRAKRRSNLNDAA